MAKTAKGGGALPAPLSQDYTLMNGRAIRFVMPDMFAFANGKAEIPNEAQAAIYTLIYRGDERAAPEKQFLYDQRWSRTLYYIFQLCCVPRVKLEADEEGEIDVREIALSDLLACFSFFRYGPPEPLPIAADQAPEQGTPADPAVQDVSEQLALGLLQFDGTSS